MRIFSDRSPVPIWLRRSADISACWRSISISLLIDSGISSESDTRLAQKMTEQIQTASDKIEVVLKDDEPSEAGVLEARKLMRKLDIKPSQLIEGAYIDLLLKL